MSLGEIARIGMDIEQCDAELQKDFEISQFKTADKDAWGADNATKKDDLKDFNSYID